MAFPGLENTEIKEKEQCDIKKSKVKSNLEKKFLQ